MSSSESGQWGFDTRAIHVGQEPDEATGAITVPIHLATTFVQAAPGQHQGFEYARTSNPTRVALERCVAGLEGASHGMAFASGMAAEDAIVGMMRPGDHVVLGTDAYGGTFRLIAGIYGERGIEWSAVDLTDVDALAAAIRPPDPPDMGGDPHQPDAHSGGHRRGGRCGPRFGSRRGGGQHLRHPVPPEPARPGR